MRDEFVLVEVFVSDLLLDFPCLVCSRCFCAQFTLACIMNRLCAFVLSHYYGNIIDCAYR